MPNGFTFVAPPAVTTVSPTSGPSAGGTAVTLTGTDFTTGATVTFGGVAATNVIVVSATSITLTTPAHSAGAVTVVVTNPDGQSGSLANGFTFVAPPAVTTVSPTSGPSAGGTAVTLTGTDFTTGATVTFGGVAATNVVVVSATSITLTTPAHSAGAVTVVVTNPDGQSGSLAERLHVRRAADGDDGQSQLRPVGRRHGGDAHRHRLHDRGDRHDRRRRGDQCDRGERDLDHADHARAQRRGGHGGRDQSGWPDRQRPNGFTFVAPPAVTTVSPNSGPSAGGTAVTLTGTDFTTGATVTFGGVAATNVIVASATSITLTTPAHSAGAVTVVVTNPDGQIGSVPNGFTFVAPPTVTTVSPDSGPSAGGTAVTLTGTDFTTGATVTFGGVAATNVIVVSATSITLTTPAHSAGAVTVVVTNPDGQTASLPNGFTFVAPPTVTTVSPTSGPSAGGTAVTLTGTDFTTGATVTFGGVAATNVIVVSATSITLTTPAHSAGAVTVVVTNPDGQIASLRERLHVRRAAGGDDRQSHLRPDGRRHGGDAHRHRLHDRGHRHVRRRRGDQCDRGERDLDHADHARAQRRARSRSW